MSAVVAQLDPSTMRRGSAPPRHETRTKRWRPEPVTTFSLHRTHGAADLIGRAVAAQCALMPQQDIHLYAVADSYAISAERRDDSGSYVGTWRGSRTHAIDVANAVILHWEKFE